LPPKGILLSADIDGVSRKPPGTLNATTRFATLRAFLSDASPPLTTARVNVDGYPRAFIFRVRRDAPAERIAPVNVSQLKLIAQDHYKEYESSPDSVPIENTKASADGIRSYKASVLYVPIELQIDALGDSLSGANANAYVEVGIDDERNRTLEDDVKVPPIRFDRQIIVAAQRLSPDGALTLQTHVDDWRIDLPNTNTRSDDPNGAELRARLVSDDRDLAIDIDTIRLDGDPPYIYVHQVITKEVEIGGKAEVRVRVHPDVPEISGVDKVQAVFAENIPNNPRDTKWEDAKPDGQGGWIVSLATEGLFPGQHAIHIRATDIVGNVTDENEPVQQTVRVIEKKPAPNPGLAPPPAVNNTVSGQVTYLKKPVSAVVTLKTLSQAPIGTAEAGTDGRFSFPDVPPGAYELSATTIDLFGGRKKSGKANITVPPPPRPSTTILELR
jgi:hypothetical protein